MNLTTESLRADAQRPWERLLHGNVADVTHPPRNLASLSWIPQSTVNPAPLVSGSPFTSLRRRQEGRESGRAWKRKDEGQGGR